MLISFEPICFLADSAFFNSPCVNVQTAHAVMRLPHEHSQSHSPRNCLIEPPLLASSCYKQKDLHVMLLEGNTLEQG